MEYEIQTQDNFNAIVSQTNLVMRIMSELMVEDVDYGKIPGTKKNTLLKPGAELLRISIRLRAVMDPIRDIKTEWLSNGHKEITVYCHILDHDGNEIATGIGSCSTLESKYRYRGGEKIPTGDKIPTDYWNVKKVDEKKAQILIGGEGFGVKKIDGEWQICEVGEKMENPDIADQYNTVLKVAKKRSFVDGMLMATGASRIFTQDYDDLFDEEGNAKAPKRKSKKPLVEPTPKNPSGSQPQPGTPKKGVLSEAQVKRFYGIFSTAKKSGATDDIAKIILDAQVPNNRDAEGHFDWSNVTKGQYDTLCEMFEAGTWQVYFSELQNG